ncbi:MerR family transcriptional regulator [Neisseria sp. Ec49-e6-T10]|uniref:MerR family transcriptional regulator n=1 Tax=Neisseria sp. Ec49-e6-T10 TaxID=3140744 RepID=UPI003EB9D8EC
MFKIGDFSRLANISVRMLRHYDKIELLKPQKTDNLTGYRYYTASQLHEINQIRTLKSMGFGLALIKEILSTPDDINKIKSFFNSRETELQEELNLLMHQKQQLEQIYDQLNNNRFSIPYHPHLKEFPARTVISLRKIIPNYMQEGILWTQIMQAVNQHNITLAHPVDSMAIFHDPEYQEQDVDVEIQMTVSKLYENQDDIMYKNTQGCLAVTVMMNGSYDQISMVQQAVAQWMEQHHYRLSGPMFNIYHVSVAQNPNPEHWVTEACYPVVKL